MKRVTIAAQYDEDPYSRLTAPDIAEEDPQGMTNVLDSSFSFDDRKPSSATSSASKNLRRLSFAEDFADEEMPLLSTTATTNESNARRRR